MKDICKHRLNDEHCELNAEFCQEFFMKQKMCKSFQESDCPDHPMGHSFVQCDEWGSVCTCGKEQK